MRRAVITGLGIVSPLGKDVAETLQSLRATQSGIRFQESYREMGLRSQVAGSIEMDTAERIDRKLHRFMGDAAAFAYIALKKRLPIPALMRRMFRMSAPASLRAPEVPRRSM